MNLFRRLFGQGRNEEPQTRPHEAVVQESAPVLKVIDEDETDDHPAFSTEPLKTRPLPPPRPFESTSRRVRFGQATDTGQIRGTNQDASLALLASPDMAGNPPPIGFFVVADGMGGHHDGELASAIAAQTLARHVLEGVVIPHLEGRGHSSEQKTIAEVLTDGMQAANRAVQDRVPNGGTTATCVVVRGDLAYIAHVGDSRAYLVSDGSMELVTRDHSLVRRLQELGQLTTREAEVHPQRNVLYRAIGQSEALEVDTATRRLPPSSRLLLCSDGLWGVIGDESIARILDDCPDPQEACDRLVTEANANGGPDNITAILVQMPD